VDGWHAPDISRQVINQTSTALESVTSPDELQAEVDAIGWFHTIDLGNGVVTKGLGIQTHGEEIFPDLRGNSVLDIGAWDGCYSFMAESLGARQVTALDHYAWGVDFVARGEYWTECFSNGTLPDHSRDTTDFWRPHLPGQRGFRLAKSVLGSKVEPYLGDFATIDLAPLGAFDVVLYLGVLYHMKEPLTCLERVRSVTRRVAVIETEALHIQGLDHEHLLQFHAGNDIHADFGNWYVPTIEALHSLCLAAGFSSVRTLKGPPRPALVVEPRRTRLARRFAGLPRPIESAPSAPYRAVVHAIV
jgi:tRNA (mo5U34)-methyltransferase